MESDAFALRTALFVLLGSLLLSASWSVLRQARSEYQAFQVVTDESVSGLAVQARVYYKGVEVGTVQDIFFEDRDFDHVKILIHIDQSIPIAENTYAQLALRGITGEYDLRLDNDGTLGKPLPTSEESPATITMRTEYISKLGESIQGALDDFSTASAKVAELLDDDNQQHVTHMLVQISDAAQQLSTLDQRLAPTIDRLPGLVDELDHTLTEYRTLAQQLGSDTAGVQQAIAQITTASKSIDRLALQLRNQTLSNADQSLTTIDQASAALTLLLEDLRQDPQRLLLGSPAAVYGPGEYPVETKQ